MTRLWAWVLEQWRLIDAEALRIPDARRAHSSSVLPFDIRLAGFLVLCTVLLVLLRTFGLSNWINSVDAAAATFKRWPHPELWPHVYWALCRVFAYVVVPGLYVALVFKERLSDLGLRLERSPRVLLLYAGLLAAVMPLVVLAAHQPSFQLKYPFYKGAGGSLEELLMWETAYLLQFVALEFFFRGAMLFPLARRLGAQAVFIVTIPYTLIHIGKPLPETLGAAVAGVVLGTVALRTRSILGGVWIHCTVGLTMDLLALSRAG